MLKYTFEFEFHNYNNFLLSKYLESIMSGKSKIFLVVSLFLATYLFLSASYWFKATEGNQFQ